jgi:aminoglycoside 6'-N-acetyltransferase I
MWEIEPVLNAEEVSKILEHRAEWAVFVAGIDGHECVGFLEVWLREYAEGASSSPVGYLEGWFVEPEFRCKGIGRSLVLAGEEWARQAGCTEMASDSEVDNVGSIRAHQRLGYREVERIVCFLKAL